MHRKTDERYYRFCSLAPSCVRLPIEAAAILDFVEQQAIKFFPSSWKGSDPTHNRESYCRCSGQNKTPAFIPNCINIEDPCHTILAIIEIKTRKWKCAQTEVKNIYVINRSMLKGIDYLTAWVPTFLEVTVCLCVGMSYWEFNSIKCGIYYVKVLWKFIIYELLSPGYRNAHP